MAESLATIRGTKAEQYRSLLPQIKALISDETDLIANMANVSAALKEQFNWFWIGFYLVKKEELIVGPFQGPIACTRISKGKGVCGSSWEKAQTIRVDDVNRLSNHIACNNLSQSEIVVPIMKAGKVQAVLDIDSDKKATFDAVDQQYLERLVELFSLE